VMSSFSPRRGGCASERDAREIRRGRELKRHVGLPASLSSSAMFATQEMTLSTDRRHEAPTTSDRLVHRVVYATLFALFAWHACTWPFGESGAQRKVATAVCYTFNFPHGHRRTCHSAYRGLDPFFDRAANGVISVRRSKSSGITSGSPSPLGCAVLCADACTLDRSEPASEITRESGYRNRIPGSRLILPAAGNRRRAKWMASVEVGRFADRHRALSSDPMPC
jgi:hypothetical protein